MALPSLNWRSGPGYVQRGGVHLTWRHFSSWQLDWVVTWTFSLPPPGLPLLPTPRQVMLAAHGGALQNMVMLRQPGHWGVAKWLNESNIGRNEGMGPGDPIPAVIELAWPVNPKWMVGLLHGLELAWYTWLACPLCCH
jgi:hypothetical protein